MGDIPDIPSKMMILTLLFLTFLSMAVGAPQLPTSRELDDYGEFDDESLMLKDKECKECKEDDLGPITEDFQSSIFVEKNSPHQFPVRPAAPKQEDLLGYYIFTTYNLLLKEMRNEANGTEIVDLRGHVGSPYS